MEPGNLLKSKLTRIKSAFIVRNRTTTDIDRRSTINQSFIEDVPKSVTIKRSFSKTNPRPGTQNSSSKYQLQKFNTLVVQKPFSSIPSGISTFLLLETILSKDPHFDIPVPSSIVLNCGFEKIMLVDSVKQFKINPALNIDHAIRHLKNFYTGNLSVTENSKYPVAILKYYESKRLDFSLNDLINSFPDTSSDVVIQKFIVPKGLRVTKYRVILNEFKKVLVLSNNIRIDAKPDKFCSNENKKKETDLNLLRTAAMHNEVSKMMKKNPEWQKISKFNSNFTDKINSFASFVQSGHKSNDKADSEEIRPSARFITSMKADRTNLFIGKNQSFTEIIKISEYLWGKIDFYYLDSCKLAELACDFMQDKAGNWFFIKIKYGKTEQKSCNLNHSTTMKKKRIVLKSSTLLVKHDDID